MYGSGSFTAKASVLMRVLVRVFAPLCVRACMRSPSGPMEADPPDTRVKPILKNKSAPDSARKRYARRLCSAVLGHFTTRASGVSFWYVYLHGAVYRKIAWDEENLHYNEAAKSATMKIDEPKTPFNRGYDYEADDDGIT
jgi:hypothetical protein